jgi:uncharacterized membrane protein YgcG
MPSFTRSFVLLAFALSATALTTPHVVRSHVHHRGLAAHISAVGLIDADDVSENPLAKRRVRNRRRNGRCNPPTSSSVPAANTQPTSPAPHPADDSTSPPEDDTTSTKTSSTKNTTPTPNYSSSSGSGGDGGDSSPSSSSGSGGGSSANEPSFMRGTQTGQGTHLPHRHIPFLIP